MKVDVLIIGGGPAGAAAAIILSQVGVRVALLERTAYDTQRVGETFPPEICVPLEHLGVWERFKNAGHKISPGIVSCWGSSEPHENDFIFNPYGCGWHVDRNQFDRMLAMAASECGADVFLATNAKHCSREAGGRWIIEAEHGASCMRFYADYVIEAVGRAHGPDRGGSIRHHYDRLVGCIAFLKPRQGRTIDETRTVIEAGPQGWWYSAPLPNENLVLAYMTDADLIPRGGDNRIVYFRQHLEESQLTRRWLDIYASPESCRCYAADTYCWPAAVANRLTTGDAAMAFDPLSSQGVINAFRYGQKAAKAILAAQAGNELALQEYSGALEHDFLTYLKTRLQYYKREQRWPDSIFWSRRHNALTELSGSFSSNP